MTASPPPSRDPQVETVRLYYEACTAGDLDGLRATLHADVVHYFLAPNIGAAPVRGAEHLARYWRKTARLLDARWVVESAISQGPETVIEWSMWWRPPSAAPDAPRIATRGAEFFRFRDGRISEIRSYYQQRPETTELDGFDHAARGWSMPGRERSALHPEADRVSAPPREG